MLKFCKSFVVVAVVVVVVVNSMFLSFVHVVLYIPLGISF